MGTEKFDLEESESEGNQKLFYFSGILLNALKKAFPTYLTRKRKALNSKKKVPASYEDESLVLSERDSRFFISVMENPPAPSKALLSIFE